MTTTGASVLYVPQNACYVFAAFIHNIFTSFHFLKQIRRKGGKGWDMKWRKKIEVSALVRSEMRCHPKVVLLLSDQQRADVGPTGLHQHEAPEVSSEAKTTSCWVDSIFMHMCMNTQMNHTEL